MCHRYMPFQMHFWYSPHILEFSPHFIGILVTFPSTFHTFEAQYNVGIPLCFPLLLLHNFTFQQLFLVQKPSPQLFSSKISPQHSGTISFFFFLFAQMGAWPCRNYGLLYPYAVPNALMPFQMYAVPNALLIFPPQFSVFPSLHREFGDFPLNIWHFWSSI